MRETPAPRQTTIWLASGRWFRRRPAAYYAIAKDLVLARYPRWLDENDLEGEDGAGTVGDSYAAIEQPPMTNWRERRRRKLALFWHRHQDDEFSPSYEHFDQERWRRFVARVARFLMFVDRRRSEEING